MLTCSFHAYSELNSFSSKHAASKRMVNVIKLLMNKCCSEYTVGKEEKVVPRTCFSKHIKLSRNHKISLMHKFLIKIFESEEISAPFCDLIHHNFNNFKILIYIIPKRKVPMCFDIGMSPCYHTVKMKSLLLSYKYKCRKSRKGGLISPIECPKIISTQTSAILDIRSLKLKLKIIPDINRTFFMK